MIVYRDKDKEKNEIEKSEIVAAGAGACGKIKKNWG